MAAVGWLVDIEMRVTLQLVARSIEIGRSSSKLNV
jgi:hypothetical protein